MSRSVPRPMVVPCTPLQAKAERTHRDESRDERSWTGRRASMIARPAARNRQGWSALLLATGQNAVSLRSALPAGDALFECRGIRPFGFPFGDCLIGGGQRFVSPPCIPQDVCFGGQISERGFDLDRLIDVLQRVVPVLVGGKRVRSAEGK